MDDSIVAFLPDIFFLRVLTARTRAGAHTSVNASAAPGWAGGTLYCRRQLLIRSRNGNNFSDRSLFLNQRLDGPKLIPAIQADPHPRNRIRTASIIENSVQPALAARATQSSSGAFGKFTRPLTIYAANLSRRKINLKVSSKTFRAWELPEPLGRQFLTLLPLFDLRFRTPDDRPSRIDFGLCD